MSESTMISTEREIIQGGLHPLILTDQTKRRIVCRTVRGPILWSPNSGGTSGLDATALASSSRSFYG